MHVSVQQALYVFSPDYSHILLLKRAQHRSMPGQHTGIWWKIDSLQEAHHLELCVWRELEEESTLKKSDITELKYRWMAVCCVENTHTYVMYAFSWVCTDRDNLKIQPLEWDELSWYHIDKASSLSLTDFTKICIENNICSPSSPLFSWTYRTGENIKITQKHTIFE